MDATLIKESTLILEKILMSDQQAIKEFRAGKITVLEHVEINRKNVETVKEIIAKIGFPTIDFTSHKAYKATVLVVLHSGDIELLNQSIKTLQNIDPSKIERRDIAYMIDKSRVIQNLPQLYGTQYNINENGVLKYIDIEQPENLEERRAEFGMESFEEYKKIVEQSLKPSKL